MWGQRRYQGLAAQRAELSLQPWDLAWKLGSTWTDGDASTVQGRHSTWAAQFLFFSSFNGVS